MKISCYPETDTFYIELKEVPSVESEEIAEGIVVDYDENGEIVGIEIERTGERREVELPFIGKLLPVSA
ncbi:MAG: DUF2283 domain-containing protein [Desulfurobacteriaceae bacterium]